jgi:anti-sigma B factor antagonist
MMIIECPNPQTCTVTGLKELIAANAGQVRDELRAALSPDCTCLDLDLSTVTFVDSSGLGALIALHRAMRSRRGTLRLLHPTAAVRQSIVLLRLNEILELVP